MWKQISSILSILLMASALQTPSPLNSSRTKKASNGLRQLIKASNECDYFKKRLRVLQNIENHNQAKVRHCKQSLDKFEHVKAEKEHSQDTKRRQIEFVRDMKQEQKQINSKNRKQHRSKISEVLREIQDEKMKDRNKIREQSQNIAQQIQKNREKQLNMKRQKRNLVVRKYNESKQNYKAFHEQKKSELARKVEEELEELEEKKRRKQMEIKNMGILQSVIKERQNQTNLEFRSVKGKLAQIYGVESRTGKNAVSLHCKAESRVCHDGEREGSTG